MKAIRLTSILAEHDQTLTLELPWPPSINHYWCFTRRGTFISKRGLAFRQEVTARLRAAGVFKPITAPLRLDIACYPPDRRRRDLDNILKSLFDALQHGGLMLDDNQVKRFSIEMLEERRGIVRVSVARHESPGGL